MGKAVEREIRAWEEQAAKAAKLKERAAGLLRQAATIELEQERLFESVILKAVYAAKLQKLPLGTVVAGLQALRDAADAEESNSISTDAVSQPVEALVGRSGSRANEATIGLVVKIGRNTAPGRFSLLNQYLTWNGKEGHWSGLVSSAALSLFEATFEQERLVVSKPNTAREMLDNGPEAPGAATQATSNLVDEIASAQPADVNYQEDQPRTTTLDVGTASPVDAATISASDVDPSSMAGPGTPPEFLTPIPTSRLPRSPFAGLPRPSSS